MLKRFLIVPGPVPWKRTGHLLNLFFPLNPTPGDLLFHMLFLLKKPLFTVFLLRLYASGSSVLPAIQFPGVSPQPLLSIKDDELKAGTEGGCSAAVLLPLIRMIKCTASSQSPNAARAWGHGDARGNQVWERRGLPSRCCFNHAHYKMHAWNLFLIVLSDYTF